MTICSGTVKNGVVVLDEGTQLPEGIRVDIRAASNAPLSAEVVEFSGALPGPPDFARNHDHYIHGAPKREA